MCVSKFDRTKLDKNEFEIIILTYAIGRRVARIFVRGDMKMKGPKVPSEARRREAPERRGGLGLGRGAVAAPPQYGGLGA